MRDGLASAKGDVARTLPEICADLSAVLANDYITEAPAAGVRELIYKPNTVEDLCETVARDANSQSGDESSS